MSKLTSARPCWGVCARAAAPDREGEIVQIKPPYKVLVVDDEPDLEPLVLQRMRRNIRRGEYTFVFAGNGVEALDRLQEDKDIDMVVSDINMPEMDGLTLLDQIPR